MKASPQPQESDSQVPWPSLGPPEDHSIAQSSSTAIDVETTEQNSPPNALESDKLLSTWRLVALSISMLGVQVAWTLELA
jgi:hypothetical protein